jgi:hypothetical protein
MKMKKRFDVYQFDHQTWVVFDQVDKKEICVCSDYGDWEDAEERAKKIVRLLNASVSHDDKTLG